MPYTCESFVADYPEFAGLLNAEAGAVSAAGTINRLLKEALLTLSPSAWGKWYDMAVGLWTAHYLALEYDIRAICAELGRNSPYETGSVTSQSASTGSLSLAYAASAMQTGDNPLLADFARTTYGLRYLNLLYTVIPPGGVVYSPDSSAQAGLHLGSVAGSAAGGAFGNMSGNAFGNTSGNTSENTSGNTSVDASGNASGNTSENASGDTSGDMSEDAPGNTSEDAPEDAPGGAP